MNSKLDELNAKEQVYKYVINLINMTEHFNKNFNAMSSGCTLAAISDAKFAINKLITQNSKQMEQERSQNRIRKAIRRVLPFIHRTEPNTIIATQNAFVDCIKQLQKLLHDNSQLGYATQVRSIIKKLEVQLEFDFAS